MSEPDLSGIDPLRVPEVRRRIAAIEGYLMLPAPTTAEAMAHGTAIGLSHWQLLRLVRVWREHRDARLLVVGRRGKTTRSYGVDPRASEIMTSVIGATGGAADLAETAPEIERRCVAEGIAPPARATVWNHIRRFRATNGGAAGGPPRVVVGRMWFHLPVRDRPASDMPTLLVAVLLPERRIVAHRLSTDPDSPPSPEALVDELAFRRAAGAATRPLLIGSDDRRSAGDALRRASLRIGSHYRSTQREISRAFGGRLGSLHAVYRRALARPATRKALSRQEEPLPADEVRAAIEAAIAENNGSLGAWPIAFDIVTKSAGDAQ